MINIAHLIPKNSTLIVGFSGGPDSTCLITLLAELQQTHNLKIIAAHLDHQWREESSQDAERCEQFIRNLNQNIIFEHTSACDFEKNIKYNGSKEDFARKMRRTFFEQLAKKYKAHAIVLAHHQNDQIETFFIRLIRGSSITGLASMKINDGLYLRPLLHTSKEKILNFLKENSIDFLIDRTNDDLTFLRNKIRHQLITALHNVDKRFSNNAIRCITHLQETDILLDQITKQTMQKIENQAYPSQYHVQSFLDLSPILQQRILMQQLIHAEISCTPTQKFFQEIIRFLSKKNSAKSHQITKNSIILKNSDYFSIKSL